MTTEQLLLENWRGLPLEKQQEVLDFLQYLKAKVTLKSRKSIKGLWANSKFDITDDDITEAKHEMWGAFPKDIEL